jgi:hypothetical protein
VARAVIRSIEAPRRADIPQSVADFLRVLAGPTWIHVPGRDRTRTRAVTTLIHGDEPSGLRAVHGWLRSGEQPAVDSILFVGEVQAALAPPGFAHRMLPGRVDLNRCFRLPFAGKEGALAAELLEKLRAARPEALIDLHNNSGHNPAYGVGLSVETSLLALTALFGRRYVHTDLRLGALVEATHEEFPSLTVECGRAGDPLADAVARAGLDQYLAADRVFEPQSPRPTMEVLEAPVRVTLCPGVRVAFADAPSPGVDLTVARDIDRHNFEMVAPGSPLGWVADGVWPVAARDAGGIDIARELFEVREGVLRARRSLIPIMMTTDARAAESDCLFYAVRRADAAPPSDAD